VPGFGEVAVDGVAEFSQRPGGISPDRRGVETGLTEAALAFGMT